MIASAIIVTLYPERATICTTPVCINSSFIFLPSPCFSPKRIPPKRELSGSEINVFIFFINTSFIINNIFLTGAPRAIPRYSICANAIRYRILSFARYET